MNDVLAASPSLSVGTAEARQILPEVYDELRKIASCRIAALSGNQTLQATALVHEAWLRMVQQEGNQWRNRDHFFATASKVIRCVLVDHIRRKARLKRWGAQSRVDLDGLQLAENLPDERILQIEEALEELQKEHPDKARIVEMKFFGGLTDREVAGELGVTERTVERHWAYARAWMVRSIQEKNSK